MAKEQADLKPGTIIYSSKQIHQRICELAVEIVSTHKNENLLVIGLLKGALLLTADIVRELHKQELMDLEIDFIRVASYKGMEHSHEVRVLADIHTEVKGRNILLVDDILDTTHSLDKVHKLMSERGAKNIYSLALVAKPDKHETPYRATYVGFTIENVWIQGYGMDTNEKGRANSNIILGPVE